MFYQVFHFQTTFEPIVTSMAASGNSAASILLGGNPITCDCAIAWFAADAQKLPYVRGATCADGDNAGTLVTDLPADFFDSC